MLQTAAYLTEPILTRHRSVCELAQAAERGTGVRCFFKATANQEVEMSHLDKADREIRKIAYSLWMEQGQPDGRDHEHWEEAKAIWAFQNRTTEIDDTGAVDALKTDRRHRREQDLLSS